jgi:hypothetical protein
MNKTEQGEPIDAVSRWMDISIEFLEMVKLLSSVAPEQVEAIAASRRDYIRMIHTIIETGDKKTLDAVMRFHAFSIRDICDYGEYLLQDRHDRREKIKLIK